MYELVIYITKVLATLTLLGHIGLAVFIIYLLIKKFSKFKLTFVESLISWVKEQSILLVFLIALSGTGFSLFYSEMAGLPPCELCWYQRIFLYPQAFLYALALKKRDNKIVDYGILLSIVGWLIAGYQYILQLNKIFGDTIKLVSLCTTGGGPACADYYFFEYGYITLPLMSLTAFTLILVILLIHKYYKK